MTTTARTARQVALAGLALTGCNLEVPSSTYLRETTLVAVLIEVVDVGPLNPGRIAVPSVAPIAEAMPYDRLRFDAFVANADGVRVPSSELDSLWFQCGVSDCGEGALATDSPLFDRDCASIEGLTMDEVCRLGAGDGEFEFELPELGQLLADVRIAQYYGVIGWHGRSAQSCWDDRRAGVGPLDHCGFIQRSVKIGPSWWMLLYAEALGLISPFPLTQIPAGVLVQQANRVPITRFDVEVDGELLGSWPEESSYTVDAGARIELIPGFDATAELLQTYFRAAPLSGIPDQYIFEATTELLGQRPFSSNAIVWIEYDPSSPVPQRAWEFAVDEYASPGTSRILMHYFDDRYGEGVAELEFEVRG